MSAGGLAGMLRGWLRRPPSAVALRVTDDSGALLVDIADAQRESYRLAVELDSGMVTVDLYRHYQAFAGQGGKKPYRASDFACNTYVKFGACLQDRRALHILIHPATKKETT